MKILFISGLLSYGGASKLIFDLLPRMKKKGHECELLILTDKQSKYVADLEKEGITVRVVPPKKRGHIGKIQYLRKWIENGHYDVVHVNLFPTIYYCSIVKRLLGKQCPPFVMTEHSTDNKRRHKSYLRPLEQFVYSNYDHIISISEKTQENLCKWLRTEANSHFSVVENGIAVNVFRNAIPVSKDELCADYMSDDVLLLTVGSFTHQKNHEKLIEALALLPNNYKLILAGEGPLQCEIENRIKTLGVQERVSFLGFRRDIASIMHSVDILVIPSIWEGFGLIAVEGMACGLPIAASDVPGLSEIVGEVGMKFDPLNPESIKNTICSINNTGRTQRKKVDLIKRAEKFDISLTVNKYLSIYDSLTSMT